MHSPQHGPQHGLKHGIAVGPDKDPYFKEQSGTPRVLLSMAVSPSPGVVYKVS